MRRFADYVLIMITSCVCARLTGEFNPGELDVFGAIHWRLMEMDGWCTCGLRFAVQPSVDFNRSQDEKMKVNRFQHTGTLVLAI